MPTDIPQHAHCQMCGKAIPVTESLCSDNCRKKYQSLIKKRRIMLYLMYGLIFVIVIFYLFISKIF